MLELEERIQYWRGRAKLAGRFGLEAEAAGARKIVGLLTEQRGSQRKMDAAVDRIAEMLPSELYEQK